MTTSPDQEPKSTDAKASEASTDRLAEELEKLSIDKTVSTIPSIAQKILKSNKILVLTGAGVSVAAGIPDFRTPKVSKEVHRSVNELLQFSPSSSHLS